MTRAKMTEEKAERLVRVMEQILSRHTGRQIEIKNYKVVTGKEDVPKKAI